MKAILFQQLYDLVPERTPEQIKQIIRETKPELILRCASRGDKTSLEPYKFEKLKTAIKAVREVNPNILLIGNLFLQVMNREERDDITGATYTQSETYNLMSFDPAQFGISSMTKCEYQCLDDVMCECKGPDEARVIRKFVPDITDSQNIDKLFQTLFVHQAQKLLEAGVDGIWIDYLFFNASFLYNKGASSSNIENVVHASIEVCNEIKKLRTNKGKIPLISTWIPHSVMIPYIKTSPYWHDKFFDFYTTNAFTQIEIDTAIPEPIHWDLKVDIVKNELGNVPLMAYIDWGFGKHQLWYLTQNKIDFNERKNHLIKFLRTFTDFFNKKGISFIYPVHGGNMCGSRIDIESPCYVLSYGQFNIFDAHAPEFDVYPEIVRLMNPSPNPLPILILLVGLGYIIFRRKK